MKPEIKRYARGSLDSVEKKLSKNNKELVTKFLNVCSATTCKTKLGYIRRTAIKICDTIEKDLDKLTLDEIARFAGLLKNSTLLEKNDIRKIFKRMICFAFPDWHTRFAGLKVLRCEKRKHTKITNGNLLDADEITKLMQATNNIRDKALVILLWETAARPEEILKLKWRDIDFKK